MLQGDVNVNRKVVGLLEKKKLIKIFKTTNDYY